MDIKENTVKELETSRDNIEIISTPELEDTRANLKNDSEVKSLETEKEKIDPGKDRELDKTKLGIKENEVNSLEKSKEVIHGNSVKSLETGKEKIQIVKSVNLETEKETIQKKEITSLNDTKEKLKTDKPISKLPDSRTDIKNDSEVKFLETGREEIDPNTKINLEDQKTELSVDSTINSLETSAEKGPESNEISELETELNDLYIGPEIQGLSEDRIDIDTAQDNSLSDEIISLDNEEEISELEDTRENLDATEGVDSLSSVVISGPNPVEKDLESDFVKLDKGEDKISSLDSTKVDGPKENNPDNLENSVISLDKPEDHDLETDSVGLEASDNVESLEDFIDTIQSSGDHDLEDTKITISSPSKVENLEDKKLDLSGIQNYQEGQQNSNFSDSLEDTQIKRNPDPGLKGRTIAGDYKLSEVELKDEKLELEDVEEVELDTDSENLPDGYSLGNRTIIDLDNTIKDQDYALSEIEENINKDKADVKTPEGYTKDNRTITSLDFTVKEPEIEDISGKNDKPEIKIPEGYTKDNRTIIDLDNTVKDPDYATSIVEDTSKKGDKSDIKLPENADLQDRTVRDLDKTVKDSNYAVSYVEKVSGKGDKADIKTPLNKASKEITSIHGYGELYASNQYRHTNRSGDGYLTPNYKLPDKSFKFGNFWKGDALNPSKYLRWAVENSVGKIPLKGASKGKLIDETLALLVSARDLVERATKSNRDRLPGKSILSGGISGKSITKSIVGAVGKALSNSSADKSQPINRPTKDFSGQIKQNSWEAPGQAVYDSEDSLDLYDTEGDSFYNGDKRKFKELVNSKYKLSENSFGGIADLGMGIGKTFNDLISGIYSPTQSLEDFKTSLRNSRYITTPEKFTSTGNATNYMTLDSNHIWEVVIKPYIGDLNGNRTWLPNFLEIDKQNAKAFNMKTYFSSGWLPITGFELQEKKLTSKDLPLYNGSISFPVGLEFTNELRLTFADDSLKSLRRYFDLCTKVSVYMSNIHYKGENGYEPIDIKLLDRDRKISNPTVYLEGKIHPGLYKNLSFIITIYILTPQFGTIKKCNLLCVIKDYTIESQGETDSSPTELSVTFSIVGENPSLYESYGKDATYAPPIKTGQKDRTGTGILENLGDLVNIF